MREMKDRPRFPLGGLVEDGGGEKVANQEAYLSDLDDLRKEIDYLLSMVPIGKSKRELQAREQAENAAGRARATISCMGNDYIVVEQ